MSGVSFSSIQVLKLDAQWAFIQVLLYVFIQHVLAVNVDLYMVDLFLSSWKIEKNNRILVKIYISGYILC